MENCLADRTPAASVSSLARLTLQDVFHAIVDVACWKHNEPKLHFPWYCIVGPFGRRWWVRGNQLGSKSGETKDKGQQLIQYITFLATVTILLSYRLF